MDNFLEELKIRSNEIDEQLLDFLFSCQDFEIFKEVMIDYRKQFEEEEKIEIIKSIKSQKKTLNLKQNNHSNKGNIFSDKSKN